MSRKMPVLMGLRVHECQCKLTWFFRDCCTNPPCASGWSCTFWGLCSVPGDVSTLSVQPKGIPTSRPALLASICAYGLMLQCRLELGRVAAPFPAAWQAGTPSLPGQEHQQPQKCPASAGRAHTACSLCIGWVWRVRSFATDAFQHVAPKASRLCSANGFACSACTFQVNDIEDTAVLLPNPQLAGHPPTKPAFVLGVKNHSETLNVNVSAVTVWSWSKRSWIFKVMADEKCIQE